MTAQIEWELVLSQSEDFGQSKENKAPDSFYTSILDNPDMVECFTVSAVGNYFLPVEPFENIESNPLDLAKLKKEQDKDKTLKRMIDKFPQRFVQKYMGSVHGLLCHMKRGEDPNS